MWFAPINPPAVALIEACGHEDTRWAENFALGRENTLLFKLDNDLDFKIQIRTTKLEVVVFQHLFGDTLNQSLL